MGKDISFKNHDRFIHLGIAIAALRKMRGMSQEQLAEKSRDQPFSYQCNRSTWTGKELFTGRIL